MTTYKEHLYDIIEAISNAPEIAAETLRLDETQAPIQELNRRVAVATASLDTALAPSRRVAADIVFQRGRLAGEAAFGGFVTDLADLRSQLERLHLGLSGIREVAPLVQDFLNDLGVHETDVAIYPAQRDQTMNADVLRSGLPREVAEKHWTEGYQHRRSQQSTNREDLNTQLGNILNNNRPWPVRNAVIALVRTSEESGTYFTNWIEDIDEPDLENILTSGLFGRTDVVFESTALDRGASYAAGELQPASAVTLRQTVDRLTAIKTARTAALESIAALPLFEDYRSRMIQDYLPEVTDAVRVETVLQFHRAHGVLADPERSFGGSLVDAPLEEIRTIVEYGSLAFAPPTPDASDGFAPTR